MSKANGAFGARLKAALRDGNLRTADLARWFGVPYPTVREWIVNGRTPARTPQDREGILKSLAVLETRIKNRRGFPFPRMTASERIARLMDLRAIKD